MHYVYYESPGSTDGENYVKVKLSPVLMRTLMSGQAGLIEFEDVNGKIVWIPYHRILRINEAP